MEFQGQKIHKSYYHMTDTRFPLSPYTLPEVYDGALRRDNGHGITWYRPKLFMSYKEIINLALQYAKGLMAHGYKKGDLICSFGADGYESTLLFIACSSIGVIFAAPYLHAPFQKTISETLHQMEPKGVFLGSTKATLLAEDMFTHYENLFSNSQDAFQQIRNFWIDKPTYESSKSKAYSAKRLLHPLEVLIEAGASITDLELDAAKSLVGMNEPCLYTMSSGTGGQPKRVLLGSALFTNSGSRVAERYEMHQDSRLAAVNMAAIELAHIDQVILSVILGCNLMIFPQAKNYENESSYIADVLSIIQEYRPTFAHIDQNFTRAIVIDKECRQGYDLATLKAFLITASCTSVGYKRQVTSQFPLSYDWYGLSECFTVTSSRPGENCVKPDSVGKPFVNMEVKVVDSAGQCVPLNKEGEIWVKGYACFLEYFGQPELKSKMFSSDGWLKTGDCGVMDEDGDLRIVGRMSYAERVKILNDVVYTTPIEKELKDLAKVKDACVIGRPIDCGDEMVYCIVPRDEEDLTVDEIKKFASEKFYEPQWPMRILMLDEIPKVGARKKISKQQVKELAEEIILKDPLRGIVKWQ